MEKNKRDYETDFLFFCLFVFSCETNFFNLCSKTLCFEKKSKGFFTQFLNKLKWSVSCHDNFQYFWTYFHPALGQRSKTVKVVKHQIIQSLLEMWRHYFLSPWILILLHYILITLDKYYFSTHSNKTWILQCAFSRYLECHRNCIFELITVKDISQLVL